MMTLLIIAYILTISLSMNNLRPYNSYILRIYDNFQISFTYLIPNDIDNAREVIFYAKIVRIFFVDTSRMFEVLVMI